MKARSKVPAKPSLRSASRLSSARPIRTWIRSATPAAAQALRPSFDRLGVSLESDQPAVRGQGQRHGERAVAGEATDLEHPAGTDQLDQQSHELTLLRRDLHAGAGQARGLVPQSFECRVLTQRIGQ